MSGLEIHHIVSKENINTKEGIGSKFSPEEKKEIEQGVDKRLLQGDTILGEDKKLNDTISSQTKLFQPHDSIIPTIDDDKIRGSILKIADEDKDGDLETHEYNNNKELIAKGYVESNKEQNPILKEFTESKKEYLEQIDDLGSQEKKLLFNDVRDELSGLQKSMFSTNSRNVSANNYDITKIAGNAVPEKIATNEFPIEAVGNNAFNYAQHDPNGIQARWNREHSIIS